MCLYKQGGIHWFSIGKDIHYHTPKHFWTVVMRVMAVKHLALMDLRMLQIIIATVIIALHVKHPNKTHGTQRTCRMYQRHQVEWVII